MEYNFKKHNSVHSESGFFTREFFEDVPVKIAVKPDLKLTPTMNKSKRYAIRVEKENFVNVKACFSESAKSVKFAWLLQQVEGLDIDERKSAAFVPVPQDEEGVDVSSMDVEQSPIPKLFVECDTAVSMDVDGSDEREFVEGYTETYRRLPLSKSLGAPSTRNKAKSSRKLRKRQSSSDLQFNSPPSPSAKRISNLDFSYEDSSHDSLCAFLNNNSGKKCCVDLQRSHSFNGSSRSDNEVFRSPERKRKIKKSKKKDKPVPVPLSNNVLSRSAIFSSAFFLDSRSEYIHYYKKRNNPIFYLSPQTVFSYLSDPELSKDITVYDCRYDYEYEGGHIKGAVHLPDRNVLKSHFDHPPEQNDPKVIIFYCEWSSERAPRSYHYIAKIDRHIHKDSYPKLRYPDIYVMEGGYSTFYECYPEECDPVNYVKMLDVRYLDQCHKFNKLYKTSSKRHL